MTPHQSWEEAVRWAALLTLVSLACVRIGVGIGDLGLPRGVGYPEPGELSAELFRFDAVHYLSIAEDGYAYDGEPSSSPNIVFAPLFPLAVRAATLSGAGAVVSGFVLNKLLLFGALVLLYRSLREWLSHPRTVLALAAMGTAAGAYAFHAFYSESTFLFCLALLLFGYSRQRWALTAVAAAAVGASRLTGFPIAAVIAALLLQRAFSLDGRRRFELIACAALSLAGTVAYLGYIAVEFGNPFVVLREIQNDSWGLFHQEPDPIRLLTGGYLLEYWVAAVGKGASGWNDIQSLNLVWTTLGLAAGLYLILAWRRHILTFVFLPYLAFVYVTNTSSPYLSSAHRYFTLMLPVFLMIGALTTWVEQRAGRWAARVLIVVLLAINAAYGILHAARFNQGTWYWF